MSEYEFKIMWSGEDGAFIATCPAFPGLSAFGSTEEEARREAEAVAQLMLEVYRESGLPVPGR